jgi:predicted nucleotidyltransferase
MTTPVEGLRRLRDAAESGLLDAFCERHGVCVLTVFGSAGRGEERPRDLDVAVLTERGTSFDVIAAVTDLVELTGTDLVDLAHLNRGGPVLRERALVGSIALYESEPGALADAQGIAIAERIETDPMRKLNLRLLAS